MNAANHSFPAGKRAGLTSRPVVLAVAVVLAVLVGWSYFWPSYWLYVSTQLCIYGLAIMGLNLLAGYTGQISLGHGAFMALGAYTTAALYVHWGVPYYLAAPLGAALTYVVGYLFGFPALRLPMLYLALSTFVVAAVAPQTLRWKQIEWLTGGVQGLVLDAPDFEIAGLDIPMEWGVLVVSLGSVLVAFVFAHRLISSQFGRLVDACRDQPLAAEAGGINVTRIKTQMFGLSAAYTGFAGSLMAISSQFVSPESFPFFLSITLLVGSFVGGVRSLAGAFLGAAFIVLVPNFSEEISKGAPAAIFGVVLVAVVFLAPDGLAAALRRLAGRFGRQAQAPAPAERGEPMRVEAPSFSRR